MHVASTTDNERQIAQPIPGERSSVPMFAFLLGWLIPGAGHMLIGKWGRGLLIFAAIVTMYAIGLGLMGKIYTPNTGELLDMVGFIGQLGMGVLYLLARGLGWGSTAAATTLNDYGSKYLVACGLLNLIAAVDANSLANGRKAS
ncbi:MAG: DUF6677 family protein [Janthinobacterium lividum]